MLNRALLASLMALAMAAVVSPPSAAYADGVDPVYCDVSPVPGCIVRVQDPGHPGGGGDGSGQGGSSGNTDPNACHYELMYPQGPPPLGAGAGAWYTKVCPLPNGGVTQGQAQWLPGAPAANPAVLAQEAVSRLRMPAPMIRSNPSTATDVLLYVPVWLWLDPTSWGARSATAAVPGLSVTATATPTRVVWNMGDGSTVRCAGPGTAWRPGTDPRAASPDCGHRYTWPSGGQPGGSYSMRATVTWTVRWQASTGQAGAVPDMTTTAAVAVRVTESQAVT